MTPKEFFKKYPVSIAYVAKEMGIERSTLSKKVSSNRFTVEDIYLFQNIINDMGSEMSNLKFEI
jgi:predicted DNA-binding protein (UPF0251 family)